MGETDDEEYVCEKHEMKTLPSGYDDCPMCQHADDIVARERHQHTRDRTREPY